MSENNKQLLMIGVTGGSSSGKTKICSIINDTIKDVSMISMDNYYKGLKEEEKNNADEYNFDVPHAFDEDRLYKDIIELKNGNTVDIPIYDFVSHTRVKDQTIKIVPKKVVIFEGILILDSKRIRDLFDIKIFIDASPETRITRRIKRDLKERCRTIDSVEAQYEKFVAPSYKKYILPTKKYADIIIPNNTGNDFIGVKILCDAILNRIRDK